MKKVTLLESILNSLGIGKAASPQEKAAPRPRPHRVPLLAADELEERIRRALIDTGTTSAVRAFLLDFEQLKGQLGPGWNRMAPQVHEMVRQSVERHLSLLDVFTPFDETSVMIVFARLSTQEAQLKCLLMAQEIARRLAGTENASDLVAVKAATVGPEGKLAFVNAPDISSITKETTEAVLKRQFVQVPPLATMNSFPWEDLQFIYRPLLSLRGMVVSTYLCLPIRQIGSRFLSGYGVFGQPPDTVSTLDLDLMVAAKVATDLSTVRDEKITALLSLPVHFETLASHRHCERYLDFCRPFFTPAHNNLVFEVVELPEGIPQSRLMNLIARLRPLGRAIIARFDLDKKNFASYHGAGLHAVGADLYYSTEAETLTMKKMEAFVDRASREHLHTYIHGIRSISLNTAAMASGFDYIDGYALTSVSQIPRQAYRYDVHSIYEPLKS